ncbi:uncharacterized protein LOC125206243 [Salvia hispanica]|uniref:uncharacterized protein LOC125206243 n=1 Tax=Salvia hispanica TaxID=49212 RepID=UPI0020099A0A|nr:uncharacterized protein LOC125206243 [Salvia hispanica]
MDLPSLVNTDEYDISDMESAPGRGKAVAVAVDDEGPKKYNPEETLWLPKNFIDVSEDPIIGNQQSGKVFWERIAQKYNAGQPRGTFERGYVKLRKHWGQVQKEMSKWNDYREEPEVHRWGKTGGKWGAEDNQSFCFRKLLFDERGPIIDLNVTDDDIFISSPSTQSRPMGTKSAKRKTKGKATTSFPTMPPPPPNPSLDKISDSMSDMSITLRMGHLMELTLRDTSTMSEFDLELHHEMIAYICAQMKK